MPIGALTEYRAVLRFAVVLIIGCLAAVGGRGATAALIDYPDFSSVAGLTLNGNAAQSGDRLRLTPDSPSQVGGAFLSSPVSITKGFTTRFRLQITSALNPSPLRRSDGIAFVIQSDPRGSAALGADGGNMGYADDTGGGNEIVPSVVIEFDTHHGVGDPSDSHVGLMLAGTRTNHAVTSNVPAKLDNGSIWTAEVTYDPVLTELSVFLGENAAPPAHLFTHTVDLATQVSPAPDVYLGFTAGSGGGFANQDILSWQTEVPEPTTLALFAVGLAGLGVARRRCRSRPSDKAGP